MCWEVLALLRRAALRLLTGLCHVGSAVTRSIEARDYSFLPADSLPWRALARLCRVRIPIATARRAVLTLVRHAARPAPSQWESEPGLHAGVTREPLLLLRPGSDGDCGGGGGGGGAVAG